MKYLLLLFIPLFFAACTSKDQDNNTHNAPPVYEANPNINTRSVGSMEEVVALTRRARPMVNSGDNEQLIQAIIELQAYALNLDNLTNPEIHHEGHLQPDYRRLIDLYGYALSLGISRNVSDLRFDEALSNYRGVIFHSCHLENRDCRTAAPFKGPYGVTILAHLLRKDIENLELQESIADQPIRNTIFSLYVLKNFREATSNVTGDLFIRFSATFFRVVDIANITDELYRTYLTDLQNQMVKQSQEEVSATSCSIFESINPLQFESVSIGLSSGLVTQLNNHFYRCIEPEEIRRRLIEVERAKQAEAHQEIEQNGAWSKLYNNFHARTHIIREGHSQVLRNFSIGSAIPLEKIYFLERVYLGRIRTSEKNTLMDRMSQDEVVNLISQIDQFAKESYVYSMLYTFRMFNQAVESSYAASGAVNTEFVQNVYDDLWEKTADVWIDYKENMTRLRLLLADVEVRLNAENLGAHREQLALMRNKMLDKKSTDDLINLSVTFPIVMATNYFVGVNGGGTMKIRLTFVDWADNTINISTTKPLKDFFTRYRRFNLQLLDFGFRNYSPTEYERSLGLATAIKTGFFDVVNFNLGEEQQGMVANLKLFFDRYVEHNESVTQRGRDTLAEIIRDQENHWSKIENLCLRPISTTRSIFLKSIEQHLYLDTSVESGSSPKDDLDYVSKATGLYNPIRSLDGEMKQIKRTYQVIAKTLDELNISASSFKQEAQSVLADHFDILDKLISKQKEMMEVVSLNGEPCLYKLEKMQKFQQNILQKQTVEYLLKVHAAMKAMNEINISNGSASDVSATLSQWAQREDVDTYGRILFDEIIGSGVLDTVATQLGLSGMDLLEEAINLVLLPHNHTGNFGLSISGLATTSDLSDQENYLKRKGQVSKSSFILSPQDQSFRVREELLQLKATAGEIRSYFPGLSFSEVSENLEDSDVVELNPDLTIKINDLMFYKDRTANENAPSVTYSSDKQQFVSDAVEILFGDSQGASKRLFDWSSQHSYIREVGRWLGKLKDEFKEYPLIHPSNFVKSNPQLLCYLDSHFDEMSPRENCQRYGVEAAEIIDRHLRLVDLYYISEAEQAPLSTVDGELGSIIAGTLLNSRYIHFYTPSEINSIFKYYKYRNEHERWTWFDGFLASNFTTDDSPVEGEAVYFNTIDGTRQYELFYEDVIKSRFDEKLILLPTSAESILRKWYRATIMNGVRVADEIIEEIRKREYSTQWSDYPYVGLRLKDLDDTDADDLWQWTEIGRRDNNSDGSLILLDRSREGEVATFRSYLRTTLKEYQCTLVPVESDADFTPELADYIGPESTFCPTRVRRWMQYNACQSDKRIKQSSSDYEINCPAELME